MVQNVDNIPPADVPALFAEITALLEDAHEITVLGQNSKLGRADHLELTGQLRNRGVKAALRDGVPGC